MTVTSSEAELPATLEETLRWPFFEAHHRDFAAALNAWAGSQLPPVIEHAGIRVDDRCRAIVRALGDAGWLHATAPAPSADEAEAIDVRLLCLARDVLARHEPLADFVFAMQGLGGGAVSLFGSASQREWLARTRAGDAIAAFALSEAQSGSDVANITTRANVDAGGWMLDGEKTWVSNGGIADVYTVFARTGEAPGARGLSAFLVPATTPGLHVVERLDVSAPHPLARIQLSKVRLPAEALIGERGAGFRIAMAVLDTFRATVAAAALGMARRALDLTLHRAATRELFGARLGDLQMVQGHLADMALAVDASALLTYRAAWTRDAGAGRVSREAAMAKLHATEHAQRVIDQAVQLHGGDGVRSGSEVERLYREVRALRIYEGASDVQRVVIARALLRDAGAVAAPAAESWSQRSC